MTALIYLVGAPGSGKSTVMAAVTAQLHRSRLAGNPARDLLADASGPVAVELGTRRGTFSGTDALPMNAVLSAEAWLDSGAPEAPLVLGEGQRLGNARFLTAAVRNGFSVTLVHLAVPAHVALTRRETRAAQLGIPLQDEAWVRGSVTKARRLAKTPPPGVQVVTLDGRRATDVLAAAVWDLARMARCAG